MKKLVFSLLMIAFASVVQAQKTKANPTAKPTPDNNLCARKVVNQEQLTNTLDKLMMCPGFQLGVADGQTSEYETQTFAIGSYNQVGYSVHLYTVSEQDNLMTLAKSTAAANAPMTADGSKKKDVRSIHFFTTIYTSGSTKTFQYGIEVKYARCDSGSGTGARTQH